MDIELLNWFRTYVSLMPESNMWVQGTGLDLYLELCDSDNEKLRLELFGDLKDIVPALKESVLSICPNLPPELQ